MLLHVLNLIARYKFHAAWACLDNTKYTMLRCYCVKISNKFAINFRSSISPYAYQDIRFMSEYLFAIIAIKLFENSSRAVIKPDRMSIIRRESVYNELLMVKCSWIINKYIDRSYILLSRKVNIRSELMVNPKHHTIDHAACYIIWLDNKN